MLFLVWEDSLMVSGSLEVLCMLVVMALKFLWKTLSMYG